MELKKGFLKGLATALNVGGCALVNVYDVSASLSSKSAHRVSQSVHRVKETLSKMSDTAINMLKISPSVIPPAEQRELKNKIRALEGKTEKLHYEIGVESSKGEGADLAIDSEIVKDRIAQVMGYRGEIDALKARLVELEEAKAGEEQKRTCTATVAIKQECCSAEPVAANETTPVESAQTGEVASETSAQAEESPIQDEITPVEEEEETGVEEPVLPKMSTHEHPRTSRHGKHF